MQGCSETMCTLWGTRVATDSKRFCVFPVSSQKPKVMLLRSLPWPFPLVENQSPQAFALSFGF